MPQATVKLQQTKPLTQTPAAEVKSAPASAPKSAPTSPLSEESAVSSAGGDGGIAIPAAMLVVSLVVFGIQLWTFLASS